MLGIGGWRVIPAIAAVVLAVAGCGGDDEGAGSSDGQGPTKVTVSETAGVPSNFVAFGIEKGFFRKQASRSTSRPPRAARPRCPRSSAARSRSAGRTSSRC